MGAQHAGMASTRAGRALARRHLPTFPHPRILAASSAVKRTSAVRSWWPEMYNDIEGSVKSRAAWGCGKASHQPAAGLVQPLPLPTAAWKEIHIDQRNDPSRLQPVSAGRQRWVPPQQAIGTCDFQVICGSVCRQSNRSQKRARPITRNRMTSGTHQPDDRADDAVRPSTR